MSAVDLAARLARKQVSAREVMTAHLSQIERVNPKVNAVVTLVADQAMAAAAKADEAIARREPPGVLHGLPVAHKDLVDTAGIRTTRGSRFYRDHVPTRDALIVTRMRAAGALTLGKTNTPEFGAGSQTFNEVFGATRNPYDLAKTCGGSSGGAAAAVACRMLPIADGSDTGGSLRNPPAFCNVVGLRPSPGRVAGGPRGRRSRCRDRLRGPWPMSRCSSARLPDRTPAVRCRSTTTRRGSGGRSTGPSRACAWRGGVGLGGIPVEPEVRRVVDGTRKVFEGLGCVVEDAEPDFTGVDDAFPTLRYVSNHPQYAPLVKERPEWVKARSSTKWRRRSGRAAPTSAGRWRDRRACTTRAASSSSVTSTSSCR